MSPYPNSILLPYLKYKHHKFYTCAGRCRAAPYEVKAQSSKLKAQNEEVVAIPYWILPKPESIRSSVKEMESEKTVLVITRFLNL